MRRGGPGGGVGVERPAPRIHVVAGALLDASGRVLVARRPGGAHLAGLWEFPGGKLMPGESREAGLSRELAEELGVRVLSAHPLIRVEHSYPDRDVVLDVWKVESFTGEPHGREGQRVEWRDVHVLDPAEFPPADVPVLTALRLPPRYLVTPEPRGDWSGFFDRLAVKVAEGFELVQLRAKSLDEPALVELARRAAEICRRGGAKLLVNTDPETARGCGADGIHLTARRLEGFRAMQGAGLPLTGASCHDARDLERARAAGCDFAVLGPVRATPTHPGAPVLGWTRFEDLVWGAGLPVFAIGGLGEGDVGAARRSGGQGVAAIRAFWGEDRAAPVYPAGS